MTDYAPAQLTSLRLQLIECASTRPLDIQNFYNKYLLYADGCSFLSSDAPPNIALLYRGKLKHYDAMIVPFLLADANPYANKMCGIDNCINPTHAE